MIKLQIKYMWNNKQLQLIKVKEELMLKKE